MSAPAQRRTVEVGAEGAATFTLLLQTEHWCVCHSDDNRVLHLRRSEVPITDAATMRASWEPIYAATAHLPLHAWALCIDMRLAPPSHDPAVEQALRESRERLSSRMTRYAVILKSAVGMLHAARLVQPTKAGHTRIFRDDEPGALQYLIHGP